MLKPFSATIAVMFAVLSAQRLNAETIVPADYKLVWSDEFSVDGPPDPSKWSYDSELNRQGWHNKEQQYYSNNRRENARVENGHLIIEARADESAIKSLPDWGGQHYSSARLRSLGKGDWTYGAFEIRAQVACGVGTWPAIWMLSSKPNMQWPDDGEIDILEHVGYDPGKVHFSTHTKAQNFVLHTENTAQWTVHDACTQMHRYQLRWTPTLIIMGVDDHRAFTLKKAADKKDLWPFNGPFHLLLNIAIGGDWGGVKGVDPSAFPSRMEIDYVHVYQPAKP